MTEFRIETLRRLTTLTGLPPAHVWDARVIDQAGAVVWACDHGHTTSDAAVACAAAQLARLEDRRSPR